MTDRQRIRVGRDVSYFPTDVEAAAGGAENGATWPAKITDVASDGSVNLFVYETDGGTIPLTGISRGQTKGTFDLLGTGPQAL